VQREVEGFLGFRRAVLLPATVKILLFELVLHADHDELEACITE
jgi:hypothetical protein